jgi:hypothetical protein
LSTTSLDKLLDKLEKRNWLRFLEIKSLALIALEWMLQKPRAGA